jgi:MFS family permease
MKRPFHYGWVIVATGTLIIMACLGFARFALGMLLPAMGEALELTYSQMGFISTGNFVGYLAAVLVSGKLYSRFGARKLIVAGLLLCAFSMIAVSRAAGFWQVLVAYVVTGLGSGSANVPVMALVSHWFKRSHRGRAAGFIVIGSGFAIVLSGWFIPLVNASVAGEGWRVNWLILGSAAMAVAFVALALLRNNPSDKGLEPLGVDPEPVDASGAAGAAATLTPRRAIAILGLIYFLFGYTYVIYATFIVTTLVNEMGFSEASAGHFWMWVGAFSLLSGPVFGTLSDRIGRRGGLAIVFSFQLCAYLLMVAPPSVEFVYLSIALYGVVAWAIPGIMAAAVGDYMGPQKAALAFGTVTLFFGVGQILGPSMAGVLADATGSFSSSYLMAAGMAAAAICSTRLLPARRKPKKG